MIRGIRLHLILRLLLLGISAAGITHCFYTGSYTLLIVFVPLSVLAVREVVHIYNRNIRKINAMFDWIAEGDYSFGFTENRGPVDERVLHTTLNRIRDILFE